MPVDSYSLREVAELLGLSKRALQKRIQEGGFPGRYLAAGRAGLETRIPAEEVQHAVQEARARGWKDRRSGATVVPEREVDSLVPYETPELTSVHSSVPAMPSGLTQTDLESLRDAMLAIVREEREMFLQAVRDALQGRDREVAALRQEIVALRRTVDAARGGVEGLERRLAGATSSEQTIDAQLWAELLAGSSEQRPGRVDVEGILRELGEIEALLGPPRSGR